MLLRLVYPNSRLTGIDLSPEAIGTARREASQKSLRTIEIAVRDLSNFDSTSESEAF
jgi:hypothetical protein